MNWLKKHKVLIAILIVILLLILLPVWFLWSKLDLIQYEDEIDKSVYETVSIEEEEAPLISDSDAAGLKPMEVMPVLPDIDIPKQDDILNILLIGTDERSWDFHYNARSDAMILVSINKTDKTVKLISLERAMGVPVLSGEYEGQWDWLTHIFRYGGADLLLETVRTCFCIEVDRYVRINFRTMMNAVDAIGGVDISLTEREVYYFNELYRNGLLASPVAVGENHLDGELALHYARVREIDSDWNRVERQRKVIIAAAETLKDADLAQLNALADQILPIVQTNFTKAEIVEWMFYAPNMMRSSFEQMTIPVADSYGLKIGMGNRSYFAVDFEENTRILHEFIYGEEE